MTMFTILLIALLASAQQKTGTVQGKVVDVDSKEPLFGAFVILTPSDGKYSGHGATTDTNGRYWIRNVEEGTYSLKSSYIGYRGQPIGPFAVGPDSVVELTLELDSYNGPTADDARRDLDSGKVQIYLASWPLYTKEQAELAKEYGFEVAYTGCIPMSTDRYDRIVIDYLKRRNGENWYEKFLKEWDRLGEEQIKRR